MKRVVFRNRGLIDLAALYIKHAGKLLDSLPDAIINWVEGIEGTDFIGTDMADKLTALADLLEPLEASPMNGLPQ